MKKDNWKGDKYVRTNGDKWQALVSQYFDVHGGLKDHVVQMQKVLREHPDAMVEVKKEEEPYSDSVSVQFLVSWWVDTTADHALVKKYIKRQEEHKRWVKEQEDREIENLRKKRPELFR